MTVTITDPPRRRPPRTIDHPAVFGWFDLVLIAAVTAAAWWLRAGGLDPSSLWLDDAWVALVHRTDTLRELRWVGFSAPGFAWLLRGWLGIVGFTETAAQAPAFAAGVATPGSAYLLLRRSRWGVAAAVTAAAVLAASPVATVYATRVKPYTLEAALCLALLGVAIWASRACVSPRRWVVFTVAGVVATLTSAFAAPYVAAGFAAGALAALRDAPRGTRTSDNAGLRSVVAGAAVYGVFALTWYLAVLRPVVSAEVAGFWSEHMLTVGDGFLEGLGAALLRVAEGLAPTPPAVTLGVLAVSLMAVAALRPVLAVLLATPTVIAVVLAASQLVPLGGGRTDLYLYPSITLVVAAAVGSVSRLGGWRLDVAVAVVVVVAVAVTAESVDDYPAFDVRPLAQELDARRSSDSEVVVYPATTWAYALYTEGGVSLKSDASSAWGFAPRFADDAVHTLPPGREDPSMYDATIDALEAEEVWLLASHWRADYDQLRRRIQQAGYRPTETQTRPGAELTRYVRR